MIPRPARSLTAMCAYQLAAELLSAALTKWFPSAPEGVAGLVEDDFAAWERELVA